MRLLHLLHPLHYSGSSEKCRNQAEPDIRREEVTPGNGEASEASEAGGVM
jgi:hypothetical protein